MSTALPPDLSISAAYAKALRDLAEERERADDYRITLERHREQLAIEIEELKAALTARDAALTRLSASDALLRELITAVDDIYDADQWSDWFDPFEDRVRAHLEENRSTVDLAVATQPGGPAAPLPPTSSPGASGGWVREPCPHGIVGPMHSCLACMAEDHNKQPASPGASGGAGEDVPCPVCRGTHWTNLPTSTGGTTRFPCTYCDNSDGKDPFLKGWRLCTLCGGRGIPQSATDEPPSAPPCRLCKGTGRRP